MQRERFPYGFFIVFVVKADDYECTGSREYTPLMRRKSIHFVVHEKVYISSPSIIDFLSTFSDFAFFIVQVSYVNFMIAVIGVLGLFSLFYIGAFVTFCFNCKQ